MPNSDNQAINDDRLKFASEHVLNFNPSSYFLKLTIVIDAY